jgi:LacI family transcriptional regulator
MKATIIDIAESLNISPSTVSRALKNNPRISSEVRKLVSDTAKEMGYRPNLLARSLVNEKTFMISLVINDISWSFFNELSQHIQNASEKLGYSIFLYSSGDDAKKETKGLENALAIRSDGLILFAHESMKNIHFLERLSEGGFPVVLLNNLEKARLDVVTVDNFKGTRLVMQHLDELGHKKIAYIGPTPVKSTERERFTGYQSFLTEKYGSCKEDYICLGKAYPLLGYDSTMKMFANGVRPTAILAYNDTMALGVMRAILESGLNIPGDISVVGFDGLDIGLSAYPPLTTVAIPIMKMADIAVEKVVFRINQQSTKNKEVVSSPQKIKLVPDLVIRNSTGIARR